MHKNTITMKQCLIGREVELNSLQEYINSERSELVAVYGRRRVGKTFLIRHAAEEKFRYGGIGSRQERQSLWRSHGYADGTQRPSLSVQ